MPRRGGTWLRLSAAAALSVLPVSFAFMLWGGTSGVAAASRPLGQTTASATETEEPTATATATATATRTATATPTGAVSAGGGGTAGSAGSPNPTVLLSLAGAGALTAGGVVLARRRRAPNE